MKTNKIHILLPILILVATSAYGFVLGHFGPTNFDAALLLWFRADGDIGQSAGPEWATTFWQGLSWLGDATPRITATSLVIVGLLYLRRWHSALFITGFFLAAPY